MFKKVFFIFGSIFVLLLLFRPTTLASDKSPFGVSYNNIYRILANGQAHVSHQIELINKVGSIYMTDYSFTVFHPNIKDVKVKDENGKLSFTVVKEKKKVKIKVHFPLPVIGVNKKHLFTISYIDNDVSQRTGRVWELNIPIIDKMSQMERYQVKVIVPNSFPHLLNSYPRGNQPLYWTKANLLGQKGIKLIFGDYQSASFKLTYFLKNSGGQRAEMSIALPPDTDYQKVIYQDIKPWPVRVEVDKDGNWLAYYFVQPHSQLNIKARGKVWIFLKPRFDVSRFLPFEKDLWLAASDVWPVDNPEIQEISHSFKTVPQVYRYTLSKLDYSYKRAMSGPDRMGAIGALKNPDLAVCMEYTDLFITLSRAIGVPAREINGYAYASNSLLKPLSLHNDVLHAWPEYYDFNNHRWHQVDPTWEDTTGGLDYFYNFDLNHITFVIHGLNPYYPLPAGAYKKENDKTKNVEIRFIKDKFTYQPSSPGFLINSQLNLNLLNILIHTGKIPLTLEINNPKGQAIYLDNLKFKLIGTDYFNLASYLPQRLIIPPFSHQKHILWISYKPQLSLIKVYNLVRNGKKLSYQLNYNNQQLNGHLRLNFNLNSFYELVILTVIFSILLILVLYSSWHFYWKK